MQKIVLLALFSLISVKAFAQDQLIIRSESTFEPTFSNRFTVTAGLNPSMTKSSDVMNLSAAYAKKLENYWLEGHFAITNGLFRELSGNNQTATGASDAQLEEQKNSMITMGVGLGRESRYAQTLLPFDDLYEMMTADITYNMYKEDFSGETFTGPGMVAKFSLHKRFSDYFSAGGHFNYNLAVVRRSENNTNETGSARSLTIGFLTVGLDLSFTL